MKKRRIRRSGSTDSNDYSLYNEDRIKLPVRGGHSDSVVSACYQDPVDSILPCAGKQTSVQPAVSGLAHGIHCIDTTSYSEPVNAILPVPSGRSITAHTSKKAKKPLTLPSMYTRINPSTREPCSQYMTTSSSPYRGSAPLPTNHHKEGHHYTQLLSGQQATNQYTSVSPAHDQWADSSSPLPIPDNSTGEDYSCLSDARRGEPTRHHGNGAATEQGLQNP